MHRHCLVKTAILYLYNVLHCTYTVSKNQGDPRGDTPQPQDAEERADEHAYFMGAALCPAHAPNVRVRLEGEHVVFSGQAITVQRSELLV